MAINWMVGVFERSQAKLGDRLVLLVIANSAREETGDSYPGFATICARTQMSERAVRYSLRRLEQAGELTIALNASPIGTNLYHLNPCLLGTGAKSAPPAKSAPEGGQNPSRTGAKSAPNTKEKPKRPVNDYPHDFEELWSAYPKGHGTKKIAYREWQKYTPEQRARMLAVIPAWQRSQRWADGAIKDLERFISHEQWTQEPVPAKANPNGHGSTARVMTDEERETAGVW